MKISIGNPFPSTLQKDCERASIVLADFITHAQEKALISETVIQNCKGLVFISLVKGAYIWSGRFGSGLVISKLENGTWSAPSSLGVVGVGYGAQAGIQFTDCVIVLKDENSLNAFMQMGNVTFGASLGLSLLPFGREAEVFWAATCGLGYSFSKSQGLYGGLSLEATLILENSKANLKAYGRKVSSKELLSGLVQVPQELLVLHNALQTRFPYQLSNVNTLSTQETTTLTTDVHVKSSMYPTMNDSIQETSQKSLNPPSYSEIKTYEDSSSPTSTSKVSSEKERLLAAN